MDPGGDFMFQQEALTQEGLHAPYEFRERSYRRGPHGAPGKTSLIVDSLSFSVRWRVRPANRADRRRGTLAKYLVLQIPGWILAAVGLALLKQWIDFPLWAALGILLLWVIKDMVLYPFVRRAYEPSGKTGVEQLIGAEGIAAEELAPSGYIRVGRELWRAEALGTDTPIAPGSRVRVQGVRGLTLLIQPEE